MWDAVVDAWTTWRLRTRYQRIVQEQLLALAEHRHNPLSAPSDGWELVSGRATLDVASERESARQLVEVDAMPECLATAGDLCHGSWLEIIRRADG